MHNGRGILLLTLLLCAGCEMDWRTDMYYQPSKRPGDLPRPEPLHAVPLGAGPLIHDRDEADDVLKNPSPADAAAIERGRAIFAGRCACCHGESAHGGGPVSKFFPPAPDLAYKTIRAHSDGYLFGTITFGGKAMPPQSEGLTAQDRWSLIAFIREVQRQSPPEAR